ncbi:LexA/Signal peptidase [Rhizodiscina lignyota]|uniref:Mitochondrial inner membrane protease subunit n=1 Tax=Rhizodiscina lignyota TaxID=1504668 RepID=A0A9P4MBL7_9PEZI|nr:LexA/Signal peptidase [Rhizodiscina lignyota]
MGIGIHLWRLTVFGCCIISINDHVLQVAAITGDSMAPTLSPTYHETGEEDLVLITKFRKTPQRVDSSTTKAWNINHIKRGDVIFFWTPMNNTEKLSVKRVVGLPGDTVVPEKRVRYGAGYKGVDEADTALDVARDLVKNGGKIGGPDTVIIPYNHVWVEGDNSDKSMDSRDYGPISLALMTGKARYVMWPWHRAGPVVTELVKTKTKTKITPGVFRPPVPKEYME